MGFRGPQGADPARSRTEPPRQVSSCGCREARVSGLAGIGAAGLYLAWMPVGAGAWLHGAVAFALVAACTALGAGAERWKAGRGRS